MIMSFKCMFREQREMREDSKNKLRRTSEKKCLHGHGRSHIAPEISSSPLELVERNSWENFPSELLLDIIQWLEATQTLWPARRDVVACASVCRSWRETTKGVVRTPEQCGLITFPISLKQPGPRDSLIQCFIKRDRVTSTYSLYLGLSPALSEDVSKLLLAAKKIRKATSTDFRISLATNDFSQSNHAYIGKLRSNFLGSKFSIYDSQRPCDHAIRSNGRSHRKCNYNVATISYELNVLRTKGPRRMLCTMNSIPTSAVQGGGIAPTVATFGNFLNEQCSPLSVSKGKNLIKFGSNSLTEPLEPVHDTRDPLILRNKAPRWHEQLQCWCLNFKARVTVASVKNFQLVAAIEPCQNVPAAEQEKVMLQFGKIGKDIFTMDYRYPLSAFQAFAICLSSFDTKPVCE